MTIRPNFVAYSLVGTWDTLTNFYSNEAYEFDYIDQSDLDVDDDIPQYWDTYAHTMKCNESFWYVQ